ncbi:MAG: type VI secretion system-associated FHA domain protein [bacterium]
MLSIQLFKGGTLVREMRTDEVLLTVGRDASASIVLEDPDKLISRQHAAIERRDGVPYLIVHSRVNPVLVDGRVMRTGQAVVLAEGARVTMSPYEMVVRFDDGGAPAAAPDPAPDLAPTAAPTGQPIDPMATASEARPAAAEVEDPITETTTPWRRNPDDGMAQATAAFLRGLGLGHLRIPPDEQAFFLERAGVMLQCVAESLVAMLAARAQLRRGLALPDEPRERVNPLLQQVSPSKVLALLVDPGRQAHDGSDPAMEPMQALREAADALRVHQAALLSGTRAALLGLLQALDPEAFDAAAARAAGPLGLNRRSRAWEAFAEAHAALVQQAAADADALLQRDFVAAYVQRLSQADD